MACLDSTTATQGLRCRDGRVSTFYVHPADFGLPKSVPAALKGGDAGTNAGLIRAVLRGEGGPCRDVVLLNAAAALFIAGRVSSVREGLGRASVAVDSGDAVRTLEAMVHGLRPSSARALEAGRQAAGA